MLRKSETRTCHLSINIRFFRHKQNIYTVMARQKGIIKLEGTIGDVSFYKSKDGYLAREKGGVDGDRIKNDPAFQRTRENGSEFGRAGKAGKLIRNALRIILQNGSDAKVTSRLTKAILQVIKTDPVNPRGERQLTAGDVQLLAGFDFNINSKLASTLYAPFDLVTDRALGDFTLEVPDLVPNARVAAPSGATHFKFVFGVAKIDFAQEIFTFEQDESAEILLDQNPTGALTLNVNVGAIDAEYVFSVLGIVFLQEVNGIMYPLKNGGFNPLTLIGIDQPVAVAAP